MCNYKRIGKIKENQPKSRVRILSNKETNNKTKCNQTVGRLRRADDPLMKSVSI